MSAANGNGGNGHGSGAGVSGARPLVLLRYRPGLVAEAARVVHLVTLPQGCPPATLTAWCGEALRPEQVEQVNPGEAGAPCDKCAISHAITTPSAAQADPSTPDLSTMSSAATGVAEWDPQAGPGVTGVIYRQWGWPVSLGAEQVWLSLSGIAVALLVPAPLASRVLLILAQRHCSPLVLAHPATPDHWVLLGAEPFPVALGWPPGVHRISTRVLLPPSMTPYGVLTWVHPPQPDALRLTREIDILAAIRTALAAPPSDAPSAF